VAAPGNKAVQSRRRSRLIRIGSTVAVIVAAGLVVWGFSRGNDDRAPGITTPPTIGAIVVPAVVQTTTGPSHTPGSAPATEDVPTIPTGTADVAIPVTSPLPSDIATP
jgi:hypothetical protein